ncbi:MAG TPA: S-layer homology domain-containing protein, partial [Chloroflexia bacterium]|nr:S-layer homology domain-containing protein [Chloroflexia bacterium]
PPTATLPGATPPASPTPAGPSPTPCRLTFTDVTPAEYFYTPVRDLACRGVISGYADGTFRPYTPTTRAQLVKIVVLGFATPLVTPVGGGYRFADVPPGQPFFTLVETAAAAGLVSGYGCGGPGEPCDAAGRPYFRPYAPVTRGQLAKITVGAAGWVLLAPPAPGTFTDVLPGTAFYGFVETAYCHGVVSGYACGGPGEPCDAAGRAYFRPGGPATRGQIAKIIYFAIAEPVTCLGSAGAPPR